MTGLSIVLFLLLLPATGFALWYRRQPLPTSDIRHPAPRRQMTTTDGRPTLKMHAIDYAAERRLIRLALAGGMPPGAVWPLLRGSPSARRRRVLKIARELARPAVVVQQPLGVARA